jgi:hypothetical protein
MKENANLWLELSLIATAIFFHPNVVVVVTAQGKRPVVKTIFTYGLYLWSFI